MVAQNQKGLPHLPGDGLFSQNPPVRDLIDNVESDLYNSFRYEVDSRHLGDMILERLLALDKVAYVRFASVYKEFQDLDEFTRELKGLK